MYKKSLIAAVLLPMLMVTQAAYATLIRDDSSGWTTDTESSLQWLHLDQTAGLSWGEIESGVGGWWSEGWRYASNDQITEFWGNADVPYQSLNQLSGLNIDAMEWFFANAMGLTSTLPSRYVRGVSADQVVGDPSLRYTPYVYNAVASGTASFYLTESGRQFRSTDAAADIGHWLVRPVSVPEPSTLVLVIAGGLLLVTRKRLPLARRKGQPGEGI